MGMQMTTGDIEDIGMQAMTPDIEDIIRDIGKTIRDSRKARGLSAADLAARAGMGRMTLQRIEAGDPGVSLAGVLRVAGAMALDLDMYAMMSPERMLLRIMDVRLRRMERGEAGAPILPPCEGARDETMGLGF